VTDNASGGSNTWVQLGVLDSNGTASLFTAFICYSCKGTGSAITVSLNQNQGSGVAGNLFCIAELSGVNALDQLTSGSNITSSAVAAKSVSTEFASEIVIEAIQSGATGNPAPSGSWSLLGATAGVNSYGTVGYQILSSTGSPTASFGNIPSSNNGLFLFSLYKKTGIPGALTMLGCGAS
jgi:hypothetical protein